nr:hypothetical protein GCM10020093_079560 [Planobispora longispora]
MLTPDSSRFWPLDQWEPGRSQPSFDKQYVRDWLTSPASGWDRASGEAPPPLPDDVVERTRDRYVEAYEKLTGQSFRGSSSPKCQVQKVRNGYCWADAQAAALVARFPPLHFQGA